MGRHGGGSSSGGSSRSNSSRSSSRSGGGSTRISNTPFRGGYRRSYYRRGKRYDIYTNDAKYGTRSGWNPVSIFILVFITFHMMIMLSGFSTSLIEFGSKVNGNSNFITIEDTVDILTPSEEDEVISLFSKIYDKTGMPVMLYTSDYNNLYRYNSIEIYSEAVYYNKTTAEDCMVILFVTDDAINGSLYDWDYDFYCGDDTYDCLSDAEFDKLLANFQKKMYQNDLVEALEYSWNSVMNDIGKTNMNFSGFPVILMLVGIYSIFYISILGNVFKQNAVYKYYKEHPEELSNDRYGYDQSSSNSGNNYNNKDVKASNLVKIKEKMRKAKYLDDTDVKLIKSIVTDFNIKELDDMTSVIEILYKRIKNGEMIINANVGDAFTLTTFEEFLEENLIHEYFVYVHSKLIESDSINSYTETTNKKSTNYDLNDSDDDDKYLLK